MDPQQPPSIWDNVFGGANNSSTDPGMMALAGLSRGFAQAAMPQPFKVPFGAALGMAGSDATLGQQQALTNQKTQQEVTGAKLANAFTAATLPSRVGMLQGGAFGSPTGGAGASGSGNPYLDQINAYIPYAMATGQDAAAAQLLALRQQMAGGSG